MGPSEITNPGFKIRPYITRLIKIIFVNNTCVSILEITNSGLEFIYY